MRLLLPFLLISIALHLLLILIKISPLDEKKRPEVTPIEIVRTEKPAETPPPQVAQTPAPAQQKPPVPAAPNKIIPRTPQPDEDLPVRVAPEPSGSVVKPDVPEETGTEMPNGKTPEQAPVSPPDKPAEKPEQQVTEPSGAYIVPKVVDPNNPPEPMTTDEFVQEQQKSERFGPDRRIRDIVREYLSKQSLPPGEDSVSFNNMSAKYDSYFYKFSRSLYGIWRYPEDAAKRGESGIVRITFDINKDGKITNINILESSGYPALDREVMRTLKSMPQVELPESSGLNVLHINGYFIYSLTGDYRLY